jgi:hypothetical protein
MTRSEREIVERRQDQNLESDQDQDQDHDREKSGKRDPHQDKEGYEVMATAEEEIDVNGVSRYVKSNDLGVEQEPGAEFQSEPPELDNADNADNANNAKPRKRTSLDMALYMSITKASQMLGMTRNHLKTWLTKGFVEGGTIVNGQIKIPRIWLKKLLGGELDVPFDGKDVPMALRSVSERREIDMAKKKETDMLQSLKDTFGAEASVSVQVYQAVGDGAWQFAREFQTMPNLPDLAIAFPEGGDFKFKIFENGKFQQEVKGIKIRPNETAMAEAGMPHGASSHFDPATRKRMPFRPGMPQGVGGGGPFNGPGRSHMDEVAAQTMGKLATKGLEGSNDNSSARIMMDGFTRMTEAQEKTQRADQERNERTLESIRAEAREEKNELKGIINEIASGQEAEVSKTLEMFKEFVSTDKEREKAVSDARLESEKERTTNMLEQQKTFFESMGELDKKRQEMADKLAEKIADSNVKIFDAQLAALAEQRANNATMFEIQKGHLEKVQELQASSQPWIMVADTIKGIQETIAPVIQQRLGSPGSSLGAAKGEQQMDANIMARILRGRSKRYYQADLERHSARIQSEPSPRTDGNEFGDRHCNELPYYKVDQGSPGWGQTGCGRT